MAVAPSHSFFRSLLELAGASLQAQFWCLWRVRMPSTFAILVTVCLAAEVAPVTAVADATTRHHVRKMSLGGPEGPCCLDESEGAEVPGLRNTGQDVSATSRQMATK